MSGYGARPSMEDIDFGPYTSPIVRQALENHRQPVPPLAVHFEGAREYRSDGSLDSLPTRKFHGHICTEILKGGQARSSGQAGLLDYCPYLKRDSQALWILLNQHPGIKIATVSTSVSKLLLFDSDIARHSMFRDLLIFHAAGNSGFSRRDLRKDEALSPMIFSPGYFRIGECTRDGEPLRTSAACGPVFLCTHPFHDPDYAMPLPDGSEIDTVFGTSASAPAAANMIMRHTMGLRGLGMYDTMSAAILATAQGQTVHADHVNIAENYAGFVFDSEKRGFGVLTDDPLAEQVARLRALAKKNCNRNLVYADILLYLTTAHYRGDEENQNTLSAIFPSYSHGTVANVSVLAKFHANHRGSIEERLIPENISITSPHGTKIELPLLVRRPSQWDDNAPNKIAYAGFTTAGFFGESFDRDGWKVSTGNGLDRRDYPFVEASLFVHCMHENSPGAELVKAYQRAARGAAPDSGFLRQKPGTGNAVAPAAQDLNSPSP